MVNNTLLQDQAELCLHAGGSYEGKGGSRAAIYGVYLLLPNTHSVSVCVCTLIILCEVARVSVLTHLSTCMCDCFCGTWVTWVPVLKVTPDIQPHNTHYYALCSKYTPNMYVKKQHTPRQDKRACCTFTY